MLHPFRGELCHRGCGVTGVHPTIDDCLEAQRLAISRLRPRSAPDVPIPPLVPVARDKPAVIPLEVKAAIVAAMFLAPPGGLMAATRRLGAFYGLRPETISTRWRRWASQRAAGT